MKTDRAEVRVFLGSVRAAKIDMLRCQQKIQEAEDQCKRITAQVSGAPGGGGDVHKDGPWAALADQRSLLVGLYEEAIRRETEVERFIGMITDCNQRVVLRLRYVDLLPWPSIQEQLQEYGICYSERQIFRIHGEALQAARALWEDIYKGEQR